MATKRMLVDATHPEETRIVVTSGNRLEEFDFEAASRRQLRGNIYLAKVTRVEPSLQAAFVEYGGNRHGFLAFSEIHPDYYQIPVADREALLADEAESVESEVVAPTNAEAEQSTEANADNNGEESTAETESDTDAEEASDDSEENAGYVEQTQADDQSVELVGGGDALEEIPDRKKNLAKRYKIQEVIKRRQVILVQVVKEERGNKGAALTTYLSLAGRYSVLMPNTARGGGISRKITNAADRKRLKEIAGGLEVPEGMGIILRTAGASRTKAEVKRDFEYLLRLWESVRNHTLQSAAPSLVYEEGSLIKRTIRDLYSKDIDELLVAGEEACLEAKDFMRMIMPSHEKKVQAYTDSQPIFSKFNVESQLDSMFSPQVTLPSGGYIVINPTEALVSIDVNSGRATKEHNIEDTAFQTNLEAAEEVSRQLRLRDMAGLIVIDFIDMMEKRSIRNVERRLKDSLRHDRARIQVGRISHFGLMEMSRQRMRFGVLESSTHVCPTCQGAGVVRSVESLALMVMRSIEDHLLRKPGNSINVRVPTDVALYILNAKRSSLSALEAQYDLSITVTADSTLVGGHFNIERGEARPQTHQRRPHIGVDSTDMPTIEAEGEEKSEEKDEDQPTRKRRRRRRGGRDRQASEENAPVETSDDSESDTEAKTSAEPETVEAQEGDEEPRKRRRRGRRGGRRNRRGPLEGENENAENESETANAESANEVGAPAEAASEAEVPSPVVATSEAVVQTTEAAPEEAEKPKRKPRRSRKKSIETEEAVAADANSTPVVEERVESPADTAEEKPKAKPRARRAKKAEPAQPAQPAEEIVVTSSNSNDVEDDKPKKGGWWQKGFFG